MISRRCGYLYLSQAVGALVKVIEETISFRRFGGRRRGWCPASPMPKRGHTKKSTRDCCELLFFDGAENIDHCAPKHNESFDSLLMYKTFIVFPYRVVGRSPLRSPFQWPQACAVRRPKGKKNEDRRLFCFHQHTNASCRLRVTNKYRDARLPTASSILFYQV